MGVPTVMVPEPLLSKAFLFVQIIVSIIHSIQTFLITQLLRLNVCHLCLDMK